MNTTGNPIEFTDPLGLQKYGRRSNTGHYGLSKAKPPKPDPTSTGKIADGWGGMKGKCPKLLIVFLSS